MALIDQHVSCTQFGVEENTSGPPSATPESDCENLQPSVRNSQVDGFSDSDRNSKAINMVPLQEEEIDFSMVTEEELMKIDTAVNQTLLQVSLLSIHQQILISQLQ